MTAAHCAVAARETAALLDSFGFFWISLKSIGTSSDDIFPWRCAGRLPATVLDAEAAHRQAKQKQAPHEKAPTPNSPNTRRRHPPSLVTAGGSGGSIMRFPARVPRHFNVCMRSNAHVAPAHAHKHACNNDTGKHNIRDKVLPDRRVSRDVHCNLIDYVSDDGRPGCRNWH